MNYLSVQNAYPKTHNTTSFYYPDNAVAMFGGDSRSATGENNNQILPGQEKTLQEIWSTNKFTNINKSKPISLDGNVKMCWVEQVATPPTAVEKEEPEPEEKEIEVVKTEPEQKVKAEESPSHHARRPPNAFLIFCKKHRPIVRERFPNLENRGVTKILGEWWALLSNVEKQPYNDLAKEYKDAFLSANPNFKWYKLPAPPLRTLVTRPTSSGIKLQTAAGVMSHHSSAEFNPGKLADESQLGGLTSLMNAQGVAKEDGGGGCGSQVKPLKKRLYSRDVQEEWEGAEEQVTKQDLMNKVVDGLFAKTPARDSPEKNGLREVRKSERMCKGKRYEMFMQEGKLLGNKRDAVTVARPVQKFLTKIETEFNNNNDIKKPETPKLDLSDTIKRLAERTNVKIELDQKNNNNHHHDGGQLYHQTKRVRSVSETSSDGGGGGGGSAKNSQSNFNLDLRISNLPCLGYDEFLQRKRDSKKRKIRGTKTDGGILGDVRKMAKNSSEQLVGSKKRKNKRSITHIGGNGGEGGERKRENDSELDSDLLAISGLATLAEVAANTQKN